MKIKKCFFFFFGGGGGGGGFGSGSAWGGVTVDVNGEVFVKVKKNGGGGRVGGSG